MADIRELDSVILKVLENNYRNPAAKALGVRLFSALKQAITKREEINVLYKRRVF